jgi:solute carrier family 45 protein 1/2/4
MGQIMAQELGEEPDPEYATRTGEFAMLLYSIGAHVPHLIGPY